MCQIIVMEEKYQCLLKDSIQAFLSDPANKELVASYKKHLRETGDWNTPLQYYYYRVLDSIEERATRHRLQGYTPHYTLSDGEGRIVSIVLGQYLDNPDWKDRWQDIANLRYRIGQYV